MQGEELAGRPALVWEADEPLTGVPSAERSAECKQVAAASCTLIWLTFIESIQNSGLLPVVSGPDACRPLKRHVLQ